MKKIKFTCSYCRATLRVPTHLAGVSAPCPKCGNTITAPHDVSAAEEVEEVRTSSSRRAGSNGARAKEKPVVKDPVPVTAVAGATGAAQSEPAEALNLSASDADQGSVPKPVPEIATAETPRPRQSKKLARDHQAWVVAPPAPQIPNEPTHAPEANEAPIVVTEVIESSPTPPAPPAGWERSDPAAPAPSLPVQTELPIPQVAAPPVVTERPFVASESVSEKLSEGSHEPSPETMPPAVEPTAPIRVVPRQQELEPLPTPTGEGAAHGELPRLDTSLSAGPEAPAASPAQPEAAKIPVPTRIQLPQPGEPYEAVSPEDFVIPSNLVEPPISPDEEPISLDELPDPEFVEPSQTLVSDPQLSNPPTIPAVPPTPDYEIVGDPTAEAAEPIAEPISEYEAPAPVSPGVTQGELPDYNPIDQFREPELEPEAVTHEEVPDFEMPSQSPRIDLEEDLADGLLAPESVVASSETGGVMALPEPGPISEAPVGAPEPEVTNQRLGLEQSEGPTGDGSMAKLFDSASGRPSSTPPDRREPLPTLATVQAEATRDVDVIDEMFGGSSEKEGASRLTVIMLSVIGAAAILTIIGVVLVGRGLGGFSIKEPEPKPDSSAVEQERQPEPPTTPIVDPSFQDSVPERIDPGAAEPIAELSDPGRSTTTLPGDTSSSVVLFDPDSIGGNEDSEGPAALSLPDGVTDLGSSPRSGNNGSDASFDERVQQIVNGLSDDSGATNSLPEIADNLSAGAADLIDDTSDRLSSAVEDLLAAPPAGTNFPAGVQESFVDPNLPPPSEFPAPTEEGDLLGQTRDLLKLVLTAPNWETQIPYLLNGGSLRPAVSDYHKKWMFRSFDKPQLSFEEFETDPELGGPFWMYMLETGDSSIKIPVFVRVEDGLLKFDWEIYTEFLDQHFVKFVDGELPRPRSLRVVVERVDQYRGSDRDGFSNLNEFEVFRVFPPYGDFNELAQYAFVKKGTGMASELIKNTPAEEFPPAAILTLDYEAMPHGIKHLVIKDYVLDGWFQ
ncbi:MAG: hypothetical protein AAF236_03560 [Verrucomicrobiota bacterium]